MKGGGIVQSMHQCHKQQQQLLLFLLLFHLVLLHNIIVAIDIVVMGVYDVNRCKRISWKQRQRIIWKNWYLCMDIKHTILT